VCDPLPGGGRHRCVVVARGLASPKGGPTSYCVDFTNGGALAPDPPTPFGKINTFLAEPLQQPSPSVVDSSAPQKNGPIAGDGNGQEFSRQNSPQIKPAALSQAGHEDSR